MGWSWALHLAQSVVTEGVLRSGIRSEQLVLDKVPPINVDGKLGAACYVDNFLCMGSCKDD
eukprot:4143293-Karenia_brevis.AAC.1